MKISNIRKPCAAGKFYPSNPADLKDEIESCFLSRFGPGSLPEKSRKKKMKAAVCPHAGYQFSGPCAAHAYKEIAESAVPDVYVILGLSHQGFQSCVSLNDWETPLGGAKNDREFGNLLSKKGVPLNEDAHSSEHSIEVQIPFIQFISPGAKICPVIVSRDMDYRKIAEAVKETAKELKKSIIIIASSDFTHYGPAYGYMPFSKNVRENMHKLDNGAIEMIKKMDSNGFLDYVEKKRATICGQLPIACMIEAVTAKNAKLLKYYTSGDISGDYANAVGYAAFVFE